MAPCKILIKQRIKKDDVIPVVKCIELTAITIKVRIYFL
jgi:hypothetical protein